MARKHEKNEKCKTCIYRGAKMQTAIGCEYILHAGHSRGCSVEECDKYEPGDRLKLPESLRSVMYRDIHLGYFREKTYGRKGGAQRLW